MSTDKQQVALYTAEEVFAQAERGNVVLRGWGATCLLRPVRHVVRVRVTRPFAQRVDWLMDHLGTDDRDAAEAEVRRSDAAHASRMNAQFGVTWGDPLLYDLVLNTDRVSVDSCVEQILQLAGAAGVPGDAGVARDCWRAWRSSARVRAALKANEATRERRRADRRRATARSTLSGIVLNEQEKPRPSGWPATVAGAGKVENQLRLMTVARSSRTRRPERACAYAGSRPDDRAGMHGSRD